MVHTWVLDIIQCAVESLGWTGQVHEIEAVVEDEEYINALVILRRGTRLVLLSSHDVIYCMEGLICVRD